MQAEGYEPQGDDAYEPAPIRLVQKKDEGATEAASLTWVAVDAGLDKEPADHEERHAAGEHPEAAKVYCDLAPSLVHLGAFQVLREYGSIGFEELPESDPKRANPDQNREPAAGRMGEHRGDRLLGAVAGARRRSRKELQGEYDYGRVGERAGDEAEPRGIAGRVTAAVQRIVDRPNEAPQGVGCEADHGDDQHRRRDRPRSLLPVGLHSGDLRSVAPRP